MNSALKSPVNARKSGIFEHPKRYQSGRWRVVAVPILILLAWFGWRTVAKSEIGEWKSATAETSAAAKFSKGGVTSSPTNSNGPKYSFGGQNGMENPDDVPLNQDPLAQREQWKKRLQRAQEVLDNYRRVTQYPYDSRPADEHGDQMYPNQAIVEEKRLFKPGSDAVINPASKLRLRTSQERIFVAGAETVLFSIAAVDGDGNFVPVNISSASIIDPPTGNAASTQKRLQANFILGADGVWSFRFSPATQGFANFTGLLRLETNVEVQGLQGFTYFDVYYTPAPPAIWAGGLREVVENGSLNIYMKVTVKTPGRYVATGRFDDATGKAFALAVFNQELAVGNQEILFRAYGKLIHDTNPPQPLKLRDVDGFLLLEDVSPDRALMPRLMGAVHTTKQYPIEGFTDAEWQSEERDRYVREYLNDVNLAKAKLAELEKIIGTVKKP